MSEAEDATMAEPIAETTGAEDAGQQQGDAKPELPVGWGEYRAVAALLSIFVLTFLLSAAFAQPFINAQLHAFEDSESVGNSLAYFGLIIVFTAVILAIAKYGKKWMIQGIILFAVASTVSYVAAPMLMHWGVKVNTAWSIGIVLSAVAAITLWKFPEWYVVDVVGVLVAAAAATIFGISLSIVPVVVLLVALAIYDAIAVYKTKHMLSLADTVIELRLPVLLVIPKTPGYSFLHEAAQFKEMREKGEPREAMFMGLGDLVMPTILVISAMVYGTQWGSLPAIGAVIGTLVGFGVLMGYVLKGNPQAGLPLLNGGALIGFMAGVYWVTGSIKFW